MRLKAAVIRLMDPNNFILPCDLDQINAIFTKKHTIQFLLKGAAKTFFNKRKLHPDTQLSISRAPTRATYDEATNGPRIAVVPDTLLNNFLPANTMPRRLLNLLSSQPVKDMCVPFTTEWLAHPDIKLISWSLLDKLCNLKEYNVLCFLNQMLQPGQQFKREELLSFTKGDYLKEITIDSVKLGEQPRKNTGEPEAFISADAWQQRVQADFATWHNNLSLFKTKLREFPNNELYQKEAAKKKAELEDAERRRRRYEEQEELYEDVCLAMKTTKPIPLEQLVPTFDGCHYCRVRIFNPLSDDK